MNIVFEVGLNVSGKRGIDYYMGNVIESLAQVDRKNRFTLFSFFYTDFENKKSRLAQPDRGNFRLLVRRIPERLVTKLEWDWGLPFIEPWLLPEAPDIYHCFGCRLPQLRRSRGVVTFYDLADEAFSCRDRPDWNGGPARNRIMYDGALRAARIISTSDFIKKELVRCYGMPEEKIEVISTGVNLDIFSPVRDPARLAAIKHHWGLPERFFMMIGPYEPPQRNHPESVLRAFSELKKAGLLQDRKLVLVGLRNRYLEKILSFGKSLGLEGELMSTGYVPIEELPGLYSLCEALIHPTGCEGFGFGLEAMACGAPFITSNLPGVVEAVGESAIVLPPGQVEPLTGALRDFLGRPELRERLKREGPARAALFPYSKIAARISSLYDKIGPRDGRA
ncbi:MAG: glycosyltransferase family 4 protein [Elusimicrobia bacterium]|nr:glycosyltransferase family 4 protein [Elusimicrobiota bacterium]